MRLRATMGRWGVAALTLAAVAGGAALLSPAASAQAPQSVPVARFYGKVSLPNGQPASGLSITATVGGTPCNASNAVSNSVNVISTDNNGGYTADIQAAPGCTTPGSTVVFTAAPGYRAQETGTIPDIPGTAVHLDLHMQLPATPTRAPTPPPPPTQVTTPRPATPPPPTQVRPPVVTPPPPVRTPVVQRPVVQQAPKGPVKAQGPKAAPAYGAGGGYVAPATAPRLPSTGTGGLLEQQSQSGAQGWALALIVLAALGVSASGLIGYRRSR